MAVFKDDFTIITTKEPRADESTPSASPTLSGFEDQLTSQGDLSALSSLRLSLKVESRSCSTQRLSRMAGPPSLKGRLTAMLLGIAGILKLFLIYLLSELLIWGCSRPLAFLNAPFFASIVAMVFLGMTVTTTASFSPTIGSLYDKYVKSDVSSPLSSRKHSASY